MTAKVIEWAEPEIANVGCCPVSGLAEIATEASSTPPGTLPFSTEFADPEAFVKHTSDGASSLHLMVENLSCAACIMKIERTVLALPEITKARVNMSTRRMTVVWNHGPEPNHPNTALEIVKRVTALGYPVAPYNPDLLKQLDDKTHRHLLAAMAVAGFAASNVMLLSVAVWAGAFSDMPEITRTLFHWVSALIALPAIAYAGQPFYQSAYRALRQGAVNMEVPISLAVLLAAGTSLYQTIQGGEHAYFDASISLLFFLLIGRYLDLRARRQARTTAEHLLALNAVAATVLDEQNRERSVPVDQLERHMTLVVKAGQRVAADGIILKGQTEMDCSLVTGETMPARTTLGDAVYAGTLNVGNPIEVKITAVSDDTLLGEIVRLVETAEQGRAKYVRIAERASRIYVPVVHTIAAAAFVGWLWIAGAGWEQAMMVAVAVLIITCPCALALAVPVVQVVATGALLRKGVIVKSADGLERLAECTYVVFDKTGTLTKGQIELLQPLSLNQNDLKCAAALATQSHHPLCRAILKSVDPLDLPEITDVEELPGRGLSGLMGGKRVLLGRADWIFSDVGQVPETIHDVQLETWLQVEGEKPVRFGFSDQLREDAHPVITALLARNIGVELLSGDREEATKAAAISVGISTWKSGALPAEKVARIEELIKAGHRVLMVGDGLNDAPALASGHASISPTSAADITQTAADFLFQGDLLSPVLTTLNAAQQSSRIVRQNFALAIGYNLCAVPIAIAGLATPLIAAIAMSSSSLLVTLNALRLRRGS